MRISIGPKQWTWTTQKGLRLFVDPIRRLTAELRFPDRRLTYRSLQEFLDAIDASVGSARRPSVYSRTVLVIRAGEAPLSCTASFSDNTDRRPVALARSTKPSVQGYVTARHGTWFKAWVQGRLGRRIVFEYVATPDRDFIIVP
jgi:hypothetical protein